MKSLIKWALAFMPLFIIKTLVFASPKNDVVRMRFGKNSSISYNLKTGAYNVYNGKLKVFTSVSANFNIGGKEFSSTGNFSRSYTETAISDGFGKGVKHTITLKGVPATKVLQVFYTYPWKSFFLAQVVLAGSKLSSNSITPFSGNMPKGDSNTRSIFVPFDNDTFIRYNSRPFVAPFKNTSSEVGTVYNYKSRRGYIVGSVEHEVWKTGIISRSDSVSGNKISAWSGFTEKNITRDEIAHGFVKGDTIKSPKIFVAYYNDWRLGMEDYARANRIAEPPVVYNWQKPTPLGWNSWGVMKNKLSYDKAVKVANFLADSLPGFRTGNTVFVDLDSYWDVMVKGGLEGDYSQLKLFANYCKSKGLQPGIYWAPFTDWGWKAGPDRKIAGTNYTYGEVWTKVGNGYHDIDGARALDPTHPATLKHIDLVIGKLKECGFKMIKIDFLGHAAAESTHFYDTTVTTGMQAFRKGMEHLIADLGNQMLIYAAISPSLATGRYVHSRRIACDAFKTLNDTQYTLNSLTYGWWQTFLYNYVDADHVVLSNETENTNHARMFSAAITGTFITGDDFSEPGPWDARAKAWYQNAELLKVIKNGKSFRPVEGNTGQGSSELFTQTIGGNIYVAVFNFSTGLKHYELSDKQLGLQLPLNYHIQNIIKAGGFNKKTAIDLNAGDAAIYKIIADK